MYIYIYIYVYIYVYIYTYIHIYEGGTRKRAGEQARVKGALSA